MCSNEVKGKTEMKEANKKKTSSYNFSDSFRMWESTILDGLNQVK